MGTRFAVGWNFTEIVQLPPAGIILPAHVSVEEKPADAVTLAIVRLAVLLEFFSVTALTALSVPASWLPKSRLAGVNATLDVAVPDPIPVRPMGCAANAASVAKLTVPEIVPLTVGTKLMLIVQLAPAASEVGQSLACE